MQRVWVKNLRNEVGIPRDLFNKWVNRFKTWFTFKKQVPTNNHKATVADKTDELKNIVNIIWASVFFVMTVRKRLFKPLANGNSLFISWNQVCWLDFSLWASSPFGAVARIHERAARERRRECECFAARSRVFSRFASLAMSNGELVGRLIRFLLPDEEQSFLLENRSTNDRN